MMEELMEQLRNVNEALSYLKDGEIVTSNGIDRFILKNERIYRYEDGTRFSLSEKDFLELYGKNRFFLYEESVEIDETKDEAYYRYYKK